ncbi:MAG: (Fe-S)-binding protein [Candidatus Dormibacteria bacterium]
MAVEALAESCRACYQCGRCRSACPQGLDLADGPRAVVRLVIAQDAERLLASEDVWRCSECGACTEACPMGVDVAGVLAEVRVLQRAGDGVRCPERSGADLAARQLQHRRTLNSLTLGLRMAMRGFLPRGPLNALSLGAGAVRAQVRRPSRPVAPADDLEVFYPGCALRVDREAYEATRALAAGTGMRLAEPDEARCCGHPARDREVGPPVFTGTMLTACPACERTLAAAGTPTVPVWALMVERARHGECRLTARSARFVPYVGCLSDRDATLAIMAEAAELAGTEPLLAHPSLHASCCGALGGAYRGPTRGVTELVRFAAERHAPIVTPCLLCRDNVRLAVRHERADVDVHFWPEFFRAAPAAAAVASAAGGERA